MKLTDLFRMRPLSVENFTREDIKEQYEIADKVRKGFLTYMCAVTVALIIALSTLSSVRHENTLLKNKKRLDVIQDSLLKQQQELLKDSV